MKKLGVFAVLTAVGASVAFAASISVPWFVDNAPAANKVPGVAGGVTGVVTLKNNTAGQLTLEIAYFAQDGTALGPDDPDNTFTLDANSSLAFRPFADDPDTVAGGQEGSQGLAVPNRPSPDGKKNGAIVISGFDNATDVQGQVAYFQTTINAAQGGYATMSYAHLLPPGVD